MKNLWAVIHEGKVDDVSCLANVGCQGDEGMIGLRPLFAVVLLASFAPITAAADSHSIDAFIGSWKGGDATSDKDVPLPDALSLEIEAAADGFQMSWPDLGGSGSNEVIEARFAPADRAGVYEYEVSSGSLLTRMFASPATGNPLEGETLIWARINDQTLAVYSMNIDQRGGFDLDHYSWTLSKAGLQLVFIKRTEDMGSRVRIEGELKREEG